MEPSVLLGNQTFQKKIFPHLDAVFQQFETKSFRSLIDRERSERVNRTLLELIQKEPEPCFLLSSVLDFIEKIDRKEILHQYTFGSFELWLNQVSGLSMEENLHVRAKIVGKRVDRGDYQAFFPIGMGKVYEGSHFVTAHRSPDLDTTISSFWGWVDAFGARVGDSLHIWNLPGGPPPSQIEIQWIFRDLFGDAVFTHLAKNRTSLILTGNDLMTQRGMVQKGLFDSIATIEHDGEETAVVIVDDQGFYLGDWRDFDAEAVRHVIILLSSCFRWFENHLHLQLISLFAKNDLKVASVKPWVDRLFQMKLDACEPAMEFTSKQKREVNDFLVLVLGVQEGLGASFESIGIQLAPLGGISFDGSERLVKAIESLFDSKGRFAEERAHIFAFLEGAVRELHDAILKMRTRLEKLDIALHTKKEVFGRSPTFVTLRSDVEEIRQKMGSYLSLTVVYPDLGKLFPVGVIGAQQVRKNILGTVSLRDFCNREEMTIPPYLDVISVIDHHKTQLQTVAPPFAIIADAQSTNTLVAAQAFEINDRYTMGNQHLEGIEAQIEEETERLALPASMRILQRLFKKRIAAKTKGVCFIHPEREYIEYLHFLYGILDDTDLLSKVSSIDVERISALLNRMKSLSLGKEVEIVSLDDLPRDRFFAKKAAKRILQNEDMYSLYKKVYLHREKEVERSILAASRKEPSHFFDDTKEQNGCCSVGQTKLFARNIPLFETHREQILKGWVESCNALHAKKGEIDLFVHMISTIVSAEEVYHGTEGRYSHLDELWLWTPSGELSTEHLKQFLSAFQFSPGWKNNLPSVLFLGENAVDWEMIFRESFLEIPQKAIDRGIPVAILQYKAGTLNSRKAMVSPFLPKVV